MFVVKDTLGPSLGPSSFVGEKITTNRIQYMRRSLWAVENLLGIAESWMKAWKRSNPLPTDRDAKSFLSLWAIFQLVPTS